MTPGDAELWLAVLRKFALALVGLVGCCIQLVIFCITSIQTHGTGGVLNLTVFGLFAGALGVGTISIGSKGSS
jgi:hypothetical protein